MSLPSPAPRPRNLLLRLLDLPVEDWLGTIALSVILVVLATEVYLRYILSTSLIWGDELSRYLLITIAYLGAATGIRKRCHVRLDLIDLILPAKALRVLGLAVDLLVLAYLVYIAWRTTVVSGILWNSPSSALGVPIGLVYLVITLGFGLAALRLVLDHLKRLPR